MEERREAQEAAGGGASRADITVPDSGADIYFRRIGVVPRS